MCKHMAKKFCKEWTKKRKFIKKMRLRKMSNAKRGEEGRSTGLEPATSGSTIQCSNQLSYDRHKEN